MNNRHLPLLAALLAAALPLAAFAQASAPPVVSPAASATPAPTGPRLLTPAEKRNNADAAAAPDLRPDRPVVPQIRIPFGRTPPATPGSAPARRGTATPAGHIGDSAARCEALPGDVERSACRKRGAKSKPPV